MRCNPFSRIAELRKALEAKTSAGANCPKCTHVHKRIFLLPVSASDLMDRYSILKVKCENMRKETARREAIRQLQIMKKYLRRMPDFYLAMRKPPLKTLVADLVAVNSELWKVEDEIREVMGKDERKFTQLARRVITLNGRRSRLKKLVDKLYPSYMRELKEYV